MNKLAVLSTEEMQNINGGGSHSPVKYSFSIESTYNRSFIPTMNNSFSITAKFTITF